MTPQQSHHKYNKTMIKQSKINSFINLIEKTHQKSKQKTNPHHKRRIKTEQTINPVFHYQKQFLYLNTKTSQQQKFGLQYTNTEFKQTFRNRLNNMLRQARRGKQCKFNLYDAYRKKLQHKKNTSSELQLQSLETSPENNTKANRNSLHNAKQISFPISRPKKETRYPMANHKLLKKRQLTSPTLINKNQLQTPKIVVTESLNKTKMVDFNLRKILQRQQFQDLQMEYSTNEPLFRVKKCPAISFQQELSTKLQMNRSLQNQKEQRQKILKATKMILPPRQTLPSFSPERKKVKKTAFNFKNIKKSQRYLKKLQIIEPKNPLDQVLPWQYDDKQVGAILEEQTQKSSYRNFFMQT